MIPVNETAQRCYAYFQPTLGDFWRWKDNAQVIEWQDGRTLCFRKEIEGYLEAMERRGWPIFSTILLVLAACQDNWTASPFHMDGFEPLAESMGEHKVPDAEKAQAFLNRIYALPRELRSPDRKASLLKAVFADLGPGYADVYVNVKEMLLAFRRGEVDAGLMQTRVAEGEENLLETLHPLILAADKFPTQAALENYLRTGLLDVPKAAEIEIPQQAPTETETPTLLDELLEDQRTCGIAHLAQHIMAALNIPMQARGSNDMPIGGVSDITNKGNLDRLLLSELAQDDPTLMARLANNEALYLRREEPPLKVEKERIVLIDSTLRLWGVPRAFAVSAAMACHLTVRTSLPMRAFSLGGIGYHEADLSCKAGIMKALEHLDPHLQCGDALRECLKFIGRQGKEIIFVTSDENLQDPGFAQKLVALQAQMDFLIVVGRNGQMQLYALHQGNRKLHSTATFDLNDLLFRQPVQKGKKPERPKDSQLPAFFGPKPAPLFFPSLSMRLRRHNCRRLASNRIAVVTDTRRVMLWRSGQLGALELIAHLQPAEHVYIEEWPGRHVFVFLENERSDLVKLYAYDLQRHELAVHDFPEQNGYMRQSTALMSDGLHFTQSYGKEEFVIDCITGQITPLLAVTAFPKERLMHPLPAHEFAMNDVKTIVNPGYSTISGGKRVSISSYHHLMVDGRVLSVKDDGELEWEVAERNQAGVVYGETESSWQGLPLPDGGEGRLRRTQFADGSVGCIDPRGFLHLRSSDASLPEVSIALIVGKPTAAWASNGAYAGDSYFFGANCTTRVSAAAFQLSYLVPIFKRILAG